MSLQVALHLSLLSSPVAVEAYVLPHVDRFFASFDFSYGLLLQNHSPVFARLHRHTLSCLIFVLSSYYSSASY